MRNWKIFTVVFILSLIVGTAPEKSKACGWFDDEGWHFNFLEQEIAKVGHDLKPFYFTWDRLYVWDWGDNGYHTIDNLGEWQTFFKGKATFEEIRYIVYQSDISELNSIEKKMAGGEVFLGPLERNSLVKYWLKKGKTEVLQYLKFAKQCEPHVAQDYSDYWDISEVIESRNSGAMEQLILEGKRLYKNARSQEIKLRYAFQVVRLAHYSGNDMLAVKSYDSMVAPLSVDGICKWWAMGHKAGALRRLGKYGESAYLYAQVFDHCPSKRVQSYDSFLLKTDQDFEEALSLCKTPEEKANLYFLRAIDPNAVAIEEIKNVWKVAPQSKKVDLLMIRELEKLEQDILEKSWQKDPKEIPSPKYGDSNVAELLSFIQEARSQNKVGNPQLWALAEAYAHFLNGEPEKGSQIAREVMKSGDSEMENQATVIDWVCRVEAVNKLDDQKIDQLFAEWEGLPYYTDGGREQTLDFLANHAMHLYYAEGKYAQAWMCINNLNGLQDGWGGPIDPDLLIAFYRKPNKSNYEEYLIRNSISCKESEAALLDVAGVHLLNQFDLEKSQARFKEIEDKGIEACQDILMYSDIFATHISSCVNCGGPRLAKPMNRYQIVSYMLELKQKVDQDPTSHGQEALELGNALFNSSYYAFGYPVRRYYRSGSSWGDKDDLVSVWAVKYLELARKNAPNPESAAQATFMLAKAHLMGQEVDVFGEGWGQFPEYNEALSSLARDYENTDFYEQVVNECSYFRMYVYR